MSRHCIADQLANGELIMSFNSWLQNLRSALAPGRMERKHRPHLEALEDRCLLSFSPAVSYPTGTNPQAVVTGYFNNDTVLDLAVANYSSSNVSVLLGNANGTFQPALTYATGAGPNSLAVG